MNQSPDNYEPEYTNRIYGVHWAVAFCIPALVLCVIAFLLLSGCTYNRNAPLINVQDSANGNTVPLVGQ